jgi:hypothetical protein
MSCNFSIAITGSPESALNKARSAVQSQGGRFEGDLNGGDFEVTVFGNKVAGTYTVSGTQLNVNITEKPFLLPCSAIEGFLKSQVG